MAWTSIIERIRFHQTKTINNYMTRRIGLYDNSKNARFEFSEKTDDYEPLARTLRADTEDLEMATVKSKLLAEEQAISRFKRMGKGNDAEDDDNTNHKILLTNA